jgi:hypothetical protein
VALRTDLQQRFSTRWWPDFSFYLDLICPYNGREFSYPQDAKLGLLGILSALERSFPGGFIHGLPRLYLDHALLWQPFGTADRRVDNVGDGIQRSSLPSWSWCGWQGFIDPWSHRSGLSYILEKKCQDRAGSWITRNLVEWHLSVGDGASEPVLEPRVLDRYVDMIAVGDHEVPNGWTRHDGWNSPSKTAALDEAVSFTHAKDETACFKHPVPLKEDLSQQSLLITTPAYLKCSTTTASFSAATVLKEVRHCISGERGEAKISVFEDRTFKRGPPKSKSCPILVLQQPNGAFAGLLRLMSKDVIDEATPLDLIAISTGSANARDLRNSLEWRLFETGTDVYRDGNICWKFKYEPEWISNKGKHALLFDVTKAFDKEATKNEFMGRDFDTALTDIEQRRDQTKSQDAHYYPGYSRMKKNHATWFRTRNTFMGDGYSLFWGIDDTEEVRRKLQTEMEEFVIKGRQFKQGHSELRQPPDQEDFICEFYNVLWIERKEGVAYRRACGWVPKYIWEAYTTGTVEVKLG